MEPTQSLLPLLLLGVTCAQASESSFVQENLFRGFEENRGQTDARVKYLSRGRGFVLFLTSDDAVVAVGDGRRNIVRQRLLGANSGTRFEGLDPLPGVTNYYIGSDPRNWRENIPSYSRLACRLVYPGIDLIYHANQSRLEYDFVVAPGGDPARIRIGFTGARKLRIDGRGDLIVESAAGHLVHRRPRARQDGRAVEARYILRANHEIGFQLGAYDATRALLIDPVLEYSSLMGGNGEDVATSVGSGGSVVAGYTTSVDFPGVGTARPAGGFDVFLAVQNSPSGSPSSVTYLGGSGDDKASGLAVLGNRIALTGETNSRNFPTLADAPGKQPVQSVYGGGASDGFVLQLDTRSGKLIHSTYLGGGDDDRGYAIALDYGYSAFVTGETTSSNFPTRNPLQPALAGGADAFVTVVSSDGSALAYSTYLGGQGDDRGRALATSAGEVYVAGETTSQNFPTASPFQPASGGGSDAFLAKLTRDGSSLAFSTYFGGNGNDRANGIGLDSDLNIYVAGTTGSSDLPIANARQSSFGGGASDAFLARFNTGAANLVYSTYIGGGGDEEALALAVTDYGDAYVAGVTTSADFPAKDPLQAALGGAEDAFLAHFDSGGAAIHATWFGGSGADRALAVAVDYLGSAWLAGRTDSPDLPVTQTSKDYGGGASDAFLARISVPVIAVPNLVIGKDLQSGVSGRLGVRPSAGRVQVTVTSGNPEKLLLSLTPTQAGSASIVVSPDPGSPYLPGFYLQALDGSGVVTYTLSAPGYLTRAARVTLTPSGIMAWAETPGRLVDRFTTTTLSPNTPIQIRTVQIDPATLQLRYFQPIRGGLPPLSVDVTSSDPGVGALTSSPVVLNAGADGGSTEFHPVGLGTATLSLGAPSGFTAPAGAVITATVIAPRVYMGAVSIGKDLETDVQLNLTAPAPAGGLDVTVTSDDPGRVLLSPDATQPGTPSLTISLPARAQNARFLAQALAGAGSVRLTASAPQFTGSDTDVTLVPSGFYLSSSGQVEGEFTTTPLSAETSLGLFPAALDPQSLNFRGNQRIRPGLAPVSIDVTSSDPKVGTITVSPVTFSPGEFGQRTGFRPLSAGSTELSIGVPAGFTQPAFGRRVKATVIPPALVFPNQIVGKDLQTSAGVTLSAPAPSGGLLVTITSADPSRVLLSTSATTAGRAQVTVTVPAGTLGASSAAFYVQALAGSGAVQLTASAPGFTSATATVTLWPTGFVAGADIQTTLFAAASDIRLWPILLDPQTGMPGPGYNQTIRGGISPIPVEIASSAPEVGTVGNLPVLFSAGENVKAANFRPSGVGTALLTILAPPGFATPARGNRIKAVVMRPPIQLSSPVIGKDLQIESAVSVNVSMPADHEVTITSLDPDKVLLSLDPAAAGSASITLRRQDPYGLPRFYMQALADDGSVPVTASAPDFTSATATVTLSPSGFALSASSSMRDSAFTTTTLSLDTQIQIGSFALDRATLSAYPAQQQAIRGGLSGVAVRVASSMPEVGAISRSPVVFNSGDSNALTQFHPLAPGTTQLTIEAPPGFSTPATGAKISATVTRPGLVMENMTVGKDLQSPAAAGIAPGVSAPAGLLVTITSTDPAKVLLSKSPRTVGSSTVSVPLSYSRTQQFYVQALAGEGAVTLKLSAEGFADASSLVTLAPSAFALTAYYSQDLRTTTFSPNTRLSIAPMVLGSQYGPNQPVRAGAADIRVEITSSDPTVAALVDSPLIFHEGDSERSFEVQPLSPGSTVLTVGVPDGFASPTPERQQVRLTVTAPRLTLSVNNSLIGKDLQIGASVAPEARPPDPVSVTVTSSDPTRVLLSADPAAPGSPSLTYSLSQSQFFVQALADSGTVALTASAPGFSSGAATVTLTPSGFALTGSGFTTTSASPNTDLQIGAAQLDPSTLAYTQTQALRGGLSGIRVEVTSSDTRAGTITTSPVVFNGGDSLGRTQFAPVAPGSAIISVNAPAGFTTPSTGRQVLATVTSASIRLFQRTIGKDLQATSGFQLAAPAPAGGLNVTVTSTDPNKLLLARSPSAAGTPSISVSLPAGVSQGSFYLQGLAGSGTVQLTASAPRFNGATTDVALSPSGFAFTSTPPPNLPLGYGSQPVIVTSCTLDPQTLARGESMELRAGMAEITVEVTNSDSTVGSITGSPLVFKGGDREKMLQFTPKAPGTTVVTIGVPPGFTEPSVRARQATVTVIQR